MLKRAFFDVECYCNFFLIVIKDQDTGQFHRFQISPNRKLNKPALLEILRTRTLIGFNSTDYDILMIQLALDDFDTYALKEASDKIVVYGTRRRDFQDFYGLSKAPWDHIDLIAVAPLKASLKIYGGRLHCRRLQDLPIPADAAIDAESAKTVFEYCCNDVNNTEIIFNELESQVTLREQISAQYNQDVRSLSDPQLAERIIGSELRKLNGQWPGRPQGLEGKVFRYHVPEYLSFELPQLQALLETIRSMDLVVQDNGHIALPKELEGKDVRIGGGKYRIGIGGLHSSETRVMHVADEEMLLVDRDVTSFYPRIILNQRLYPAHLGPAFLEVYNAIVERRVAAKRAKDLSTAETLKIAVNGSFGKLGSKWSILYAPELCIQVTITGQLVLLLLIQMIEGAGFEVVSANTDGVLTKVPVARRDEFNAILAAWEARTQFQTEESLYRAVYSKDVNNYIAIKTNGEVKGKGLYSNPWEKPGANVYKLQKNPSTTIVIEAVIAFLRDGVKLEDTIMRSDDITKFIALRAVTGGAEDQGVYVGKAVRWYYSTAGRQAILNYKKSGYKVPKTDGMKLCMDLPDEFPDDMNYDWYMQECYAVLNAIGYLQPKLF